MLLRSLLLIIVLFNVICLRAQEPFMHHITDEDGLPSMEVYQMIQDTKGYFWIGTDNGLCRYDGRKFKSYYHPKQRGKSFSMFKIDSRGRIWMVNFAGQLFYIENDTLKLFEPFEKYFKSGFPRFDIDNDDNVWIASIGNPLLKYDTKKGDMTEYPDVVSEYLLSVVFRSHYSALHYPHKIVNFKTGKPISPQHIEALQYSKYQDKLYCLSSVYDTCSIYEVHRDYSVHKISIPEIPKRLTRVTDFVSFSDDNHWLLTYDGLFHFGTINNQSKLFGNYLKGNSVSWVIRDNEGNYWITTLKNGIFMIPALQIWIANRNNSILEDDRVTELAKGNGDVLYAGMGSGNIAVFNTSTRKFERTFNVDPSRKDFEAMEFDATTNTLFAQTSTFYQIDGRKEKVNNSSLQYSAIKDLSEDGFGNLLVCNSMSALIIAGHHTAASKSPFYRQFKFVRYNNDNISVLREQRTVTCFVNKHDTTLWVGFIDGLYYYKNGVQYELLDNNKSHIYATEIAQGANGIIWVGTVQQGLYAIRNAEIIYHITSPSKLISNFIRCLAADENYIWLATDKGVQGINIKSGNSIVISKLDGLATTDVLDMHSEPPYLYLGTSKGLQWVNTEHIKPNTTAPLIFINRIAVNDLDTVLTDNAELPYSKNNITIYFNGISPRARDNIQYQYRLIGLDTQWIKVNASQEFVRFTTLPAGQYTFEVSSINENGISSRIPARINFVIKPPYWQRWWFVILIAILLVAAVSVIFSIRIRNIRNRNKLERDKSKLELELRASQLSALKVQMNPHFIFNALNSIQEYILTNEKKLANSFLGKFSDLMRLYLDMSNRKNVALEEEIKAMRLYLELEAMRFEDSFEYSLTVDEELTKDEIEIPPMIIQPYIENAIKHGLLHKRTDRKLSINFMKADGLKLKCIVTDNGIGRKQSMELNKKRKRSYASFATGATQKRLELLNYGQNTRIGVTYEDLTDTYGNATGTRVIISI
jgi:ligand-binding sensor domain-containing protein